MGLILLFLFAGFMFLFVVLSVQTDIWYVVNFTRQEWYRELRRDYFTSRAQCWRDWRSLKRFARANGAWIYATLFGTLGLVLTVILLIVNLPNELKARVRNVYAERKADEQPLFVTRDGSIDTRTQVMTDIAPVAADRGLPVLVDVRQAVFERVVRDDVPFEPRVVEPVVSPQPTPRAHEDVDLDAAFADFVLERTPEPKLEPEPVSIPDPLFGIEITRVNEVTSTAVFDVESVFVRLAGDQWEPEDKLRVPVPPKDKPLLYRERYNDVHLSLHEREGVGSGADLIRLRPRAAGQETTPGLMVRKSIAHRAVAGQAITYEIEIANPHTESLGAIIVEETVPAGWSIVDANPRATLVGDDTLRWDIEDLKTDQSHRLTVKAVVGQNEAARSRTVVTTGAAVASRINVNPMEIAPDPVTIEPVPVIVNDSGWKASKSTITSPLTPKPVTPPALPPGRVQSTVSAKLFVDVKPRVNVGPVEIRFTVTNTGSSRLQNPMLLVWLEKEISHRTGLKNLQRPIGPLDPQESRTLTLSVRADAVGAVANRVQVQEWPTTGSPGNPELLTEGEAVFSIERDLPDVEPASYSGWRAAPSR